MNSKEVVALYPLMPTKYSPQKRKELRKFEKELLKGRNIMLKKSEVILNAGKSKPQTNDEWRKTCSTEEFAKLMSDAMWYGEQCATEGVLCENCKCPWCEGISNWLKQPHNREE